MQAYLARHPETRVYQDYIKSAPLPDSFANGTYYSINAFRFINRKGEASIVRWAMRPATPLSALDKAELDTLPTDFLFNDILARLGRGPVRWRLAITLAEPGDVTDNATIRWPSSRRTVTVGTLVVDRAGPEERGACRDINFDPTILPAGIALSDDPLLAARSAAYSASFRRRAMEGPRPSAIGKAASQQALAKGE